MERLRFILFGFNIGFGTIGSFMIGTGIGMFLELGTFKALNIANAAGIDGALWSAAVFTFIAIGAFLMAVVIFGVLDALRADRSTFFLWLYAGSIGLMFMAEIVVVILTVVYWKSITKDVAKSMYNDVHFKYVNETSPDGISTSWNNMQQEWICCGSFGYQDYFYSNYDNNSDQFRIPDTCCVITDSNEFVMCRKGIQEHVYQQGCYFALVNFVNNNAPIVISATCGFAVLQIIGLLFACFLIFGSKRKKKQWGEKDRVGLRKI